MYDRKIIVALQEAQKRANLALEGIHGTGIGAQVRDAQIRTALSALSHVLASLFQDVGSITAAGMEEARIVALDTSFDWDDVLLSKVFTKKAEREAMKSALLEVGRFNVEALIRHLTQPRIPLSHQVYRTQALANKWVETTIASAIGRGASPAELAAEVRVFISPDAPGGASYAAKRLARTEINTTYHAVAIAINEDKPWNIGMVWHTSRSHPATDICDMLASANSGLGKGVYATKDVPQKPHPQCFCFVVPKTVKSPEFLRAFNAGEYDDWLAANYGL